MHQNSSFIDKNKIIRVKKSISDDLSRLPNWRNTCI